MHKKTFVTNDYYSIYSISVLGFIFFFFIPGIYFLLDGIIIPFLIGVIGLFFYWLGLKTNKQLKIKQISSYACINIVAISIIVYNLTSGVYDISSSITIDNYTEKYKNSSQIDIYSGLLTTLIIFSKYYIVSIYVSNNKKRYFLALISFTIVNLITDTRLNLITPIIFWIGYGYYFDIIKINKLRIALVIISIPFIFTFLLIKRIMKGNYENILELFDKVFNYLTLENLLSNLYVSMETFRSYELYIKIINENFIHPESGFLRIFFMFIPRNIWPDKPESISRIISLHYYPEQYYGGGGTVANIFGDAFVNGGLIGILIILFLFGFISKLVYNSTIFKIKFDINIGYPQKSFLICFYLLYLIETIHFFRGFMSESFWKCIYLFIFTLIISSLLKKKEDLNL